MKSPMQKFLSRMAAIFVGTLALLAAGAHAESAPAPNAAGVITVKSAYKLDETIARLKADVAAKGIPFFSEINQSKLAADAGIAIKPSVLLVFGNPPLGTLFIKANPQAGLDWPVRLLVHQDDKGQVWASYSDFAYIARRHGISGDELKHFQTASGVIGSITSAVVK